MLGTITWLPRNNMANLRVFKLGSWNPIYGVTRLLDLLESSPLLHTVKPCGSIPDSSNAPPQRTVLLPHLNDLVVQADQAHSIVLNHLRIPMGASISQYFHFGGTKSPLIEYLPEASTNLMNLSHVNTVKLRFDTEEKFVEFSGPSGSLRVFGRWKDWVTAPWFFMDREILRSLSTPILSTVRKLSISRYGHPGPAEGYDCPIFQTLSSMTNLQTLELTECDNQPFILALDPEGNESKLVLCPDLENLVLSIESWGRSHFERITRMAENRASRGARVSSIRIVFRDEPAPEEELSKLAEYVARVEYRVDKVKLVPVRGSGGKVTARGSPWLWGGCRQVRYLGRFDQWRLLNSLTFNIQHLLAQ